MKKLNVTIIATIIATFAIAMFAFQPTTTGASNNASPSATPRKIKKAVPNPTGTTSPIVRNKPNGWSFGQQPVGVRRKQPKRVKN